MQRLLRLAVLSLLLAGCAAPEAPLPPVGGPGGPAEPPGEEAAAPPADDDAPEAGIDIARHPPRNDTVAPSDTAAGPEPAATGDAAPAAPPAPSAEPAPPAPPAPPATPREAALPTLKVGDAWTYTGTNLTGAPEEEYRQVAALGEVRGVPVYVMNVTVNGALRTLNVTRDGLNTINGTGVVTELLRFPLAAGKNWSFDWQGQRANVVSNGTSRGMVRQAVHGEVAVLGLGKVKAGGVAYDAWRLHANVTTSVGAFSKWISLEYWYSPADKAIVRAEQHTQMGQQAWSDLVYARLG